MSPDVDLRDLKIEDPPARGGGGRFLVVVLLLLLPAAFAAGWWFRGGGAGAVLGGATPVRVEAVRSDGGRGAVRPGDFTEGGWVEVPSYHPVIVSALLGGRVEELLVLEGAKVTKGQVVARLYDRDLEDAKREADAAVDEARAELDLFEAGYRVEDVEKARAEVERQEREVELAGRVLTRTRELLPSGAASAEEAERHETALRVASARLDAARQELKRLEAGFRPEEIEEARAALARAAARRRLAESRLGYAEVTSPIDGVVLERFVTPGSWLAPQNPRVVSLYDPEDLQARVDVRQENARRVRVGQKVTLTTDAEPDREYQGVVTRLEPMADFKKNTIQAKVKITEPGPRLRPEMICRVRFLAPDTPGPDAGTPRILTVDSASIVREDGRAFVWLVRDDRVSRVEVRLGEERGGRVAVESGLAEGDRIVVAPPAGLAEGQSVEVR